jgi:type III secretory pathway component EscS
MTIFFIVLAGLLGLLAWIGLLFQMMRALVDLDDDGLRPVVKFFVLLAIWLMVTAGLAAGGWKYLASQQSDHGSCKLGHYEPGAKGQRYFFCDVYYPLPQVEGQ